MGDWWFKDADVRFSIVTLLRALDELRNVFAPSLDRSLTESDDAPFYGELAAEFKHSLNDRTNSWMANAEQFAHSLSTTTKTLLIFGARVGTRHRCDEDFPRQKCIPNPRRRSNVFTRT
jgi:hypothetical protein